MPYTPTNWVDATTPLSAANMNNLETQYQQALNDVVANAPTTATPNALAKRDSSGNLAGNITGNAATATSATTAASLTDYNGTHTIKATWSGSAVQLEVDTSPNEPVQNALQLNGLSSTQFANILSGGYKVQSGLVTGVVNGLPGTTVTFPTAFSAAPIVFVSYVNSSGSETVWVTGTSAGSFTFTSTNSGTGTYLWMAIGT